MKVLFDGSFYDIRLNYYENDKDLEIIAYKELSNTIEVTIKFSYENEEEQIPIDEDYSEEIDIIFNLFASVTISIDKKCLHNESDREDSIINFKIEQDEDGIEIVYEPYGSYCKPIDDTILTSKQQQFVNNYIYKYYVKSLFSIDANIDTVGYYSPVYLYLEKIPK